MTDNAKPWMPSRDEIRAAINSEMVGALISRAALDAQIEREESHRLDWKWQLQEATERLSDIDTKIAKLRAEREALP